MGAYPVITYIFVEHAALLGFDKREAPYKSRSGRGPPPTSNRGSSRVALPKGVLPPGAMKYSPAEETLS